MLLSQPWDKGDKKTAAPAWSKDLVTNALSPIPVIETDIRHVKSPRNGEHYPYYDLKFACGCNYIGDRGWDPCENELHALLADAGEKSTFAVLYFKFRDRFDAALAEAWKRHPEAVRDEDLRGQGLDLTLYRLQHDILFNEIWQRDGLHADLAPIPYQCRLSMYNGGTSSRPRLVLQLTRDNEPDTAESDAATEIAPPIDVSDYSVEQILALLPAPTAAP